MGEEVEMASLKYERYIVTDLKLPEETRGKEADYNRWAKHLLWLDDHVIEGAPFVNTAWYFKPEPDIILAHTHDFGEVVGFFGSDFQNPYDLQGEIEFWLEDEKYILKSSCYIYIPKRIKHCPMSVIRVEKPIFHLSLATVVQYSRNA